MPLFKKKPVVIEARQFTSSLSGKTNADELVHWIVKSGGDANFDNGFIFIRTLETHNEHLHKATELDWIIRGIQGEFYPCKPDIFTATYEEVLTNS